MPSRKSESRKSDVSPPSDLPASNSNARFALKDDYQEPAPAAEPTTASEPAPEEPAATESTSPPLVKMSHPKQAQSNEDVNDETEDESADKKAAANDATTIEDLTLPKSIITRLAKGVLPANTQIQANAVLAMSKSTTVFVNYLAASANDHTMSMGKKTIGPADVFKALEDTEFGFLKERLEAEYNKFNQIQTEKRTSYRAKVKAAKSGPNDSTPGGTAGDISMADSTSAPAEGDDDDEDGQHKAKKARVDPDATINTVEHDDAMTEDEEPIPNEEDDAQDDVVEEDDEDDERVESEDETQGDGLEERVRREERDEALDGDDSD